MATEEKPITRMTKTRWIILIIVALIVGVLVVPVMSWLIIDESIAASSGSEFCVSCHTMEPMYAAYLEDVHGGSSAHGAQVLCVDCHLDHTNSVTYLFTKAQTGMHDIWVQYTQDTSAIDWEAKREHRESFTYESGCLHCHTMLEEATEASHDAFIAHRPYFLGEIDDTCVSCHPNVGHKDLSDHLQAAQSSSE